MKPASDPGEQASQAWLLHHLILRCPAKVSFRVPPQSSELSYQDTGHSAVQMPALCLTHHQWPWRAGAFLVLALPPAPSAVAATGEMLREYVQ